MDGRTAHEQTRDTCRRMILRTCRRSSAESSACVRMSLFASLCARARARAHVRVWAFAACIRFRDFAFADASLRRVDASACASARVRPLDSPAECRR
eukprot:2538503-Pleurochrysis_carterae.AAC.1